MRHQQAEDVVFLGRELHLLTPKLHDTTGEIDREVARNEHRSLASLLEAVPECSRDPRNEFLHAERLGHVVVRAQVECLHLPLLVAPA
jgi:hypothetical protein